LRPPLGNYKGCPYVEEGTASVWMKSIRWRHPSDPSGISSNGCEKAKQRIAAALSVDPSTIKLDRYELNLPGWAFHCTGRLDGGRFFAKTYLNDFNPPLRRITRSVTPWQELELLRRPEMSFGGNVGNELCMLEQIRQHDPDRCLPSILGSSVKFGTLVLEELRGVRMDRHVRWQGWPSKSLRASADIIRRAGRWLRKIHDSTSNGFDELHPAELAETIRRLVALKKLESTRYGGLALGVMKSCMERVATDTVFVPRCLCHGDFTLVNIIWDANGDRLRVIDLEHSVFGNVLHDVSSLIFNLRSELLYPWASSRAVKFFEEAFRSGYGAISDDLAATVDAISTARLFYSLLPRLLHRGKRRGWLAGAEASLYVRWLEPMMLKRTLRQLGW